MIYKHWEMKTVHIFTAHEKEHFQKQNVGYEFGALNYEYLQQGKL